MERRYHMEGKRSECFIEAPETQKGHEFLASLRNEDARFKGQRIRAVLQASPSIVEKYRVLQRS